MQTFAPDGDVASSGGVIVERDAPDRVVPSEREVPTGQGDAPGANDTVNDVSLQAGYVEPVTTADGQRAPARSPAERLPMALLGVVLVLLVGAVGAAAWTLRRVDRGAAR